MYIKAKLVFDRYIPDQIEKGTWFKQTITQNVYGRNYTYDRVFQMNSVGRLSPEDFDSFIQMHGAPVNPVIVGIPANQDDNAVVIAFPHEIGWIDDGPGTDELRDIEIKDINHILEEYDGELEIEVSDSKFEEGLIVPIKFMDKVTVRLLWNEDDYLYEQDNYPPDDEEDWDDMDDLTDDDGPEHDSAGFTSEDR